MGWFNQIGNTVKSLQMHLFGKGIMTLAVLAAAGVSAATGIGWVLPVVAIGGVVLTAVNRLYDQRLYEDSMVNLYRGELASQFGIAPDQVTRAHLKEAAKDNEVLGQALARQRNKTLIAVGTAVLSSAVTFGLVGAFGADSGLKTLVENVVGNGPWAGIANFIGIGTVAGLSSLVFKGGLQTVIGATTGVGKAAAHDRILEIDFRLNRGHLVSKEQVYGVLVASDTKLQHSIERQFHKPYSHMRPQEQAAVMQRVGVANAMQDIANQINGRELRPSSLAMLMQETPAPSHRPASAAVSEHASAQQQGNFVERLGLAPRAQNSFREQLTAERAVAGERAVG